MPSPDHVERFVALVEQGEFVQAFEEFYDDDARVQENMTEPRSGLSNLIKHERAMLGRFREVKGRHIGPILINGDHVVINWLFTFATKGGQEIRLDELTLQRWADDRIVDECFYYDPAQMG